MKCYRYNYNYNDYNNLTHKRKLIIKNEESNLLNKHIKIINKLNEKVIKKVIGIEFLPTEVYNSNLDVMATGGYYSNSFTIDYNKLRKDYRIKNNKLIILTLA